MSPKFDHFDTQVCIEELSEREAARAEFEAQADAFEKQVDASRSRPAFRVTQRRFSSAIRFLERLTARTA